MSRQLCFDSLDQSVLIYRLCFAINVGKWCRDSKFKDRLSDILRKSIFTVWTCFVGEFKLISLLLGHGQNKVRQESYLVNNC